jgi:hypothetical protein
MSLQCCLQNTFYGKYALDVSKKIQLDATLRRHLFTAKSLYMFRASLRRSSGVLKTVTASSGIGNNIGAAASFQCGLIKTSPDQTTLLEGSRRPLTCWDRGFVSHGGHGYLSVVSVVCCQVEVSATSWSLVQRSPTDCGASLCVI